MFELYLENTDNLELFKKIGLTPGNAYYSPVNKETKPSTFIYFNKNTGKYLFKDFSSGISGGPVEYLAAKLYNGDITRAKEHLLSLYRDASFNLEVSHSRITDIIEVTIDVKPDYITEQDNYFTQKLHIPINKLARYGILKCLEFTIKNKTYKNKECYLFVNHKLKPLQLYLPYRKEKKHINLRSAYEYHFINNKSNVLLISGCIKDGVVSSYITNDTCDVLCLLNENYTQSQHHVLNKKKNTITERYKTIVLLFDNDNKGRESSTLIKEAHPNILIPNYEDLYQGCKDISDYIMLNPTKNKTTLWKKLKLIINHTNTTSCSL